VQQSVTPIHKDDKLEEWNQELNPWMAPTMNEQQEAKKTVVRERARVVRVGVIEDLSMKYE